tara:strand:- start:3696 stop:3935 length:240 start_codon:yes stop_codon:yes gene_type:complete
MATNLQNVNRAIAKAKAILQEANVNTLENKDDLMGEEVKVKKPKKNPAEEKIKNPTAKDDTSSGYGHVGDKHYIGKTDN